MNLRYISFVISASFLVGTCLVTAMENPESVAELSYDFKSPSNNIILNKSESYSDINLKFNDQRKIQFRDDGIHFIQGSSAQSTKPPSSFINEIKKNNSLSLELWFKPANLIQKGPARIFSLSGGTSDRNLTIGQEGKALQIRIRTTRTSNNGLPAMETNQFLETQMTHVFYTFGGNEALSLIHI